MLINVFVVPVITNHGHRTARRRRTRRPRYQGFVYFVRVDVLFGELFGECRASIIGRGRQVTVLAFRAAYPSGRYRSNRRDLIGDSVALVAFVHLIRLKRVRKGNYPFAAHVVQAHVLPERPRATQRVHVAGVDVDSHHVDRRVVAHGRRL